MEQMLKKQLIESVNAVKTKMKRMRNEEDETNLQFSKVFKPITDPLNAIANERNNFTSGRDENKKDFRDNEDTQNELRPTSTSTSSNVSNSSYASSNESLKSAFSEENDFKSENVVRTGANHMRNKDVSLTSYSELDVPFGIRRVGKELLIGNSTVTFPEMNTALGTTSIINIGGRHYELTEGLKEVLFRKSPDLALVTEKDKITYKDILLFTSAHKRNYEVNGQIKGDKGIKYKNIIKPLFFPGTRISEGVYKVGGNLSNLKKQYRNLDFAYWDDPNELIERLKLLVASKDAGNNNHDNEIISIIEELQEAGIIKQ